MEEHPGYQHLDMDPRWQDFDNFVDDMGERPPGMTIERRNNALGYWPKNCYWATPGAQAQNRRSSKLTEDQVLAIFAEYGSTNVTQAELGRKYGVTRGTICNTLRGVDWPELRQRYDAVCGDLKERMARNKATNRRPHKKWKLTPAQARIAKIQLDQGRSATAIGEDLGVHRTTVMKAVGAYGTKGLI